MIKKKNRPIKASRKMMLFIYVYSYVVLGYSQA